uniref:Uncharacterized protein n=1 Tax=Physcomitrium patens TaxID=3218 RepID=A0A2K1JR91_PHYPA|nr:hypothetical protein PHYPA_016441 [Physcomitrium patens]
MHSRIWLQHGLRCSIFAKGDPLVGFPFFPSRHHRLHRTNSFCLSPLPMQPPNLVTSGSRHSNLMSGHCFDAKRVSSSCEHLEKCVKSSSCWDPR